MKNKKKLSLTGILSLKSKGKELNAFSLIELIVGITISMVLMTSVGVFVSNGMKNIFSQQKALENIESFNSFSESLKKSINLIQSGSIGPEITSSGILFKRGQFIGEGGFTYIGEQTLSGVYCGNDSENSNTKNIFIKNFIPFEEELEDIYSNFEIALTGSVSNGLDSYISYQKDNIITKNGTIVVGKGIYGNKFIEGASGTGIYLNSPTGLAFGEGKLFIADTLNNRVLYLSGTTIHKLLDESDGLNEPTGLYYNDYSLYIANSGNGEILKYSSKSSGTAPALTMSGFTVDNVNKVEVTFSGASINVGLSNYSTGSFTFDTASSSTDFLTGSTNSLKYYFINYSGTDTTQGSCSGTEIDLDLSDNPIKCTSSGTGQTSSYTDNILSKITIKNINSTTNTGTYFVNLKLLDSTSNILYQDYFHYFTQSDNDLTTANDNILEIFTGGLNYPTGIWGTGSTDFNQFSDGGFSDMSYNKKYDKLLNSPIKQLTITNNSNLLTILLNYYKKYDCYNLDEKIENTYLLKKSLK